MFCPRDHQVCLDDSCRSAGCRICGAAPLEACADCGHLVVLVRRVLICDACMASYGEIAPQAAATTSKG